jgi:hypothetical protein
MITLTFTPEQIKIIGDALMEFPYRLAAPLISEINQQIKQQQDGNVNSK